MNLPLIIVLATFLISSIAFIGVLILFLKERLLNKLLLVLVSFSAGALIGGAFLHLLPEAIKEAGEDQVFNLFLFLILGFCVFFVLENFIHWHHHHAKEHPNIMPFSYLILVSDAIHNFIDGLVIAASFAVSLSIGAVTTLAIALHEIPQEIGDFGILIYGGFKKIKALLLNFASATTVILGGIVGFLLSEQIGDYIIFMLPFAAGNFIYIAAADLIPEIKSKGGLAKMAVYFFFFLLGIAFMFLLKLIQT